MSNDPTPDQDDAEGHAFRGKHTAANEDDAEGHAFRAGKHTAANEDDAEGHGRFKFDTASTPADTEDDDAEGHGFRGKP